MNLPGQSSIAREQLRIRLLRQRSDIDDTVRAGHDVQIMERLETTALLVRAEVIAVYWPIRSEPDLDALVQRWRRQGKRLALPVVGGPNRGLLFCAWDAQTVLVAGPFGIAIPQDRTELAPDCLVIPCVGFRTYQDRLYRLGYGAGYYDRTLARRPTPSVGVAYDEAESAEFVPSPDDAPLSVIATPSRSISSIASP